MIGLINADAKFIPLKDNTVQTIVTSPPYFGLRSYSGTMKWVEGSKDCDHSRAKIKSRYDYSLDTSPIQTPREGTDAPRYMPICPTCGARKVDLQIGLESTVQDYVDSLVTVFRELRRILRPDGTVWLNLGDSYNGSGGPGSQYDTKANGKYKEGFDKFKNPNKDVVGLKPKDLIGVPWRVAFALQADGWYLRSDIIWNKPNPMPESVTDRPSKCHEYIFLLTKSQNYFYDIDAIRDPLAKSTIPRMLRGASETNKWVNGAPGSTPHTLSQSRPHIDPRDLTEEQLEEIHNLELQGRNKRSVWNVATVSYPGSHFATYPPELIEPCIKSGTSQKGACSICGAPWEHVVDHGIRNHHASERQTVESGRGENADRSKHAAPAKRVEMGWKPTCDHNASTVPCIVFDPFCGSGTTMQVARSLGRSGVGTDVSYKYLHEEATERLELGALRRWTEGIDGSCDLSDLPLFSNISG